MLVNTNPTFQLTHLPRVAAGMKSPFETETEPAKLTELPGLLSETGKDKSAKHPGSVGVTREEAFAKLSEEASKPQPGQAVKEELIRTASVPSKVPLAQEKTPLLQTSGLDWSGSVDGATLLRVSQELSSGGEPDSSTERCNSMPFPPRGQYRMTTPIPSLGRLSEDWGKSSNVSDSFSTSMAAADVTMASSQANRTASSILTADDVLTPTLSKHPSLNAPAETLYESPFEAPQFQEEPIVRPILLPEVVEEEVTRSAATVPPSQIESMLTPSPTTDTTESPMAATSPSAEDRLRQDPDRGRDSHKGVSISELRHSKEPNRWQTGMKSMSALEKAGVAILPEQGLTASRSQEIQLLTVLRKKLAEEAGYKPSPFERPGTAQDGERISFRSQTEPASELLRALEGIQQDLGKGPSSKPALRTITSGTEADISEDEVMTTTASLQQDLSKFNPLEEGEITRSPPRAPSLFDLATSMILSEGSEWIIHKDEIELGRCIGSGSFGDVYRAQWRHTDVAVKRLSNVTEAIVEDFKQEVALMSKLKHPNVVQFLGACVRFPDLAIVTQFLPRGSLFSLLHRAKVQLDYRQKLWMALDCAKGMHYLHSCRPPIVHGDVSSKNMLVDRDFSIKVADFGMSRQRRKAMLSAKGQSQGTAEWTAPEILRGLPYSESCDVYSFGVVLYELMTQQVPWGDLSTIQVVGAVGWGNASLAVPQNLDPKIRQLMLECMERDPDNRPTFADIIVSLRKIRQEFQEPPRRDSSKRLISDSVRTLGDPAADQLLQEERRKSLAEEPTSVASRRTM